MALDRDEELIKKAFNSIHTKESNIKLKVNSKLNEKNKTYHFKRVAFAFSMVFLVISVPVIASGFPSFERLLNTINSDFDDRLEPIELVSENNGIKMEVVAAMRDEDMAVVYITLQDIEGDRIDKTLDLNDSYRITGLNAYTSEVVDYNEITKTATIRVQANGNKKINKIIEFSLGSFISNENNIDTTLNDYILSNIGNENKNTVKLDMNNIAGGSGELFEEFMNAREVDILEKGNMEVFFDGAENMKITNVGIINNKLHIQTKWDKDKYDNHGYIYLTNKKGEKINTNNATINHGFDETGKAVYGNDYLEYIFDLDGINLSEVVLNASVFYSENYVEGPWKTTFKLNKTVDEKSVEYNETIAGVKINSIKISAMGIVLTGDKTLDGITEISINMKDGTKEVLDSSVAIGEKKNSSTRFISDTPINIEGVESIEIDGKIIEFN